MQQDINKMIPKRILFPNRIVNKIRQHLERSPKTKSPARTCGDILGKKLRQMMPTTQIAIVQNQMFIIPDERPFQRRAINKKTNGCNHNEENSNLAHRYLPNNGAHLRLKPKGSFKAECPATRGSPDVLCQDDHKTHALKSTVLGRGA